MIDKRLKIGIEGAGRTGTRKRFACFGGAVLGLQCEPEPQPPAAIIGGNAGSRLIVFGGGAGLYFGTLYVLGMRVSHLRVQRVTVPPRPEGPAP